jgi:hypothetical protein
MSPTRNKLDPFAERLVEWRAEGLTLAKMREQLALDGCVVGISSISDYCLRLEREAQEKELFATIATGGRMNRELDAAFAKDPAPEIEQLIRVSKTLIMSLQVQGVANPKLLALANSMQETVLTYLSGRTKAELEARKLELSESKYRDQVAERKRALQAEVDKAKSSGGITPETLEKIEAELKLL